ncbi:MAG TPA: ABC transporter substrate-binding protein [Chloroflexota bacterium]|nr:ABC transporter substrate-binding protein [Chloroflexota bacterium]
MAIPLRLVYRSRPIQYPLLAAMNACHAWERAGLDLQSVTYVAGAEQSDPMLLRGECDFIFGSHISPYLHRYHGQPFVYLGQTVNWVDDVLVSREPLQELRQLVGKRLAEDPRVTPERHHGHHPGGNHLLYLRRAGVDPHTVTFVPSERRALWQAVASGEADAAFVSPPQDEDARRAGLHVLRLPPLPMVQASTMTTLWPTVQQRPELCEAVLKAVLMGIHFFKTQPGPMWEVMQRDVAVELRIDRPEVLRSLYQRNQALLEPRLYPRPEAIANAFALAVMEEPALAEALQPLSLWDLHLLRAIEESGFIESLYEGHVPGPGTVPQG